MTAASNAAADFPTPPLQYLQALEKRVLWLSSWIIHHANHLRAKRDGLKVGGHQASSASSVSLLTALFFAVLRSEDRIAVKPHASPAFHAIQYLLGNQTLARLQAFRALGGAQSYPSRTKDHAGVDFSTGSEGLGAAITIFGALVQDYLRAQDLTAAAPGRLVALLGDAEFDEGNVFEALLEGWKHGLRNVWWIIDYNRQSLDRILDDQLYNRIEGVLRTLGWEVQILKYGRRLQHAFTRPGGQALRQWLDSCPNDVYSALVYAPALRWRERLQADIGAQPGVATLLASFDDAELARLMTNLGGHDMECLLEAFGTVADDRPRCFLAYTIKGYGLPFAGHKDNHAGLMSVEQIATLRDRMGIPEGAEWEPFAGLGSLEPALRKFVGSRPLANCGVRRRDAARIEIGGQLSTPAGATISTQEAFGRILTAISHERPALAGRLVTTSPDVMVSTNLGGWVNSRQMYGARAHPDAFKELGLTMAQRWSVSPHGQHIELGIAENNFFLLLGALGLSAPLFGVELFPIGTIYDTFIPRGLDALNYACYQNSRFILIGTPSGITLAPEGGAHQAITTPLIGIGQPGLTAFEPAFADETAVILDWACRQLHEPHGQSVYLRLSTRPITQPRRPMDERLRAAILRGGYWLAPPGQNAELAIVCAGAVLPEAIEAYEAIRIDEPNLGLAVITSPDRLYREWNEIGAAQSHIGELLAPLAPQARLITVMDGHPLTLSWIGGVRGQRVLSLGVTHFGQSGDIPSLYREYRIDARAIVQAAAQACLERAGWRQEGSTL